MEEEKEQKENDRLKQQKGDSYWQQSEIKPPSVYKDNGEVRICNQGRYQFFCNEDDTYEGKITFEIKLPKYLDTKKINLDLNPQYVRIEINEKVTQWKFEHEIIVEKSEIKRSQTTGVLVIQAPIQGFVDKGRRRKEDDKILEKLVTKAKVELDATNYSNNANKELKKGVCLDMKDPSNKNKLPNQYNFKSNSSEEINKSIIHEYKEKPKVFITKEDLEDIDLNEIPELD